MGTLTVVVVAILLIVVLGVFFIFWGGGAGGSFANTQSGQASANLRQLVQAQRVQQSEQGQGKSGATQSLAVAAAAESQLSRKKLSSGSQMTLEKQLKYARWKITPMQFRAIQFFVTVIVFIPAYLHLAMPVWLTVMFMTPILVKSVLSKAIKKRFEAFDVDYPVLLMSYVSLLKTGMSTISGLDAAAKGLDPTSLVRQETEILMERLRLGLTEEQSISSFGEDIAHPELELFVQSLLLSRKVGGTLSTTLERLARQVRKRQQFRQQAEAVVGMERSSLYAIAFIMTGLLSYMAITSPELILPALTHPAGTKFFQGGVCMIIWGFYLSRVVTHIKI